MRLQVQAPPPLSALLDEAIARIEASVGIETAPDESPLWTPNQPQPLRGIKLPDGRVLSPQQLALETPADETAFGGGPGGGKSDLMLGAAITRHKASAIFRRQFSQFKGPKGLMSRSREIIGLRGVQANNTWRDLPGGRALEFLGCDYEKDLLKYLGRGHDFKGFDEVTEFPEMYYRRLVGWLRTDEPGQRTRVIVTFNPPQTEEGRWVYRYWAPWLDPVHQDPAKPGELRWFVVDVDGNDREVPGPKWGGGRAPAVQVGLSDDGSPRMINPRSRTFVPSAVEDNPYYMATGYADQLDALPEPMRSQMRSGNFRIALPDHEWQVMPTAWVLLAQARWRPDGGDGIVLTAAGTDPSRGGQDEFVNALRYDSWIAPLDVHPATAAPDGETGAALVFRAVGGDTAVPVRIDIGGSAGSSVFDFAKRLRLKAIAMNGAAKSKARDRSGRLGFVNKRAAWHWGLREALDPALGVGLALPPDPQLRADLCAMRWTPTIRGIQIEDKEAVKARIGRSPDRGEAVIYACALDGQAAYELLFAGGGLSDAEQELARLNAELGIGNGGGNGANGR